MKEWIRGFLHRRRGEDRVGGVYAWPWELGGFFTDEMLFCMYGQGIGMDMDMGEATRLSLIADRAWYNHPFPSPLPSSFLRVFCVIALLSSHLLFSSVFFVSACSCSCSYCSLLLTPLSIPSSSPSLLLRRRR